MICTIPFSVLLDTRFSAAKKTAIERQTYTSVSRVYVQTRSCFWHAKGLSGLAYTDLPRQRIYLAGIGNGTGRGILHTYTWDAEGD
jgi:monoamine oxidase